MNFAVIIENLRKEKDWSQTELATKSGASRVMIGKYERGDAIPSLDAAKKIADALGVSLDYLVGEESQRNFDKKNLNRLQEVENLSNKDKEHVYALLDAFLLKCEVEKRVITK
jgi:transcriptional regulator with XRE-family HTH domain